MVMWGIISKYFGYQLGAYPTTLEEDEAILAQQEKDNKLTDNQAACVLFRLGEKKVLTTWRDYATTFDKMFKMSEKEARKAYNTNQFLKVNASKYVTQVVFPILSGKEIRNAL